jgi:hypothetical protein
MLQVVLVLVLGGTIGIAAIIRQVKIGPSGVPLMPSIALGQVKVRLPAWELTVNSHPRADYVIQATERNAAKQPTGRVLEYRQETLAATMKSDAFLISTFKLPPGTPMEPMKIAGTRGVFARVDALPKPQTRPATRPADDDESIDVRLSGSGRPMDERDVALVRQVANTLQLINMDEGSVAPLPPG